MQDNWHLLGKNDVAHAIANSAKQQKEKESYIVTLFILKMIGLHSSFVPPLIYAALGSSPTDQPLLYLHLALTATFFAGLFQTCLGLFRLGFLIDYLSKATLIGFMAGAAVIVSMQPLKGLLGIVHFAGKTQIIPVVSSVFHERPEYWSWQTIVMGFSFLLFLLIARLTGLKKPKLFWISAAAPLTSVVLSTLSVFIFKTNKSELNVILVHCHRVLTLNPSTISKLYSPGPHLGLAIKTGLITGILSLTEGIAVGRTFATLQNYQIDGNKEMIAIGLMNMAGSCSSCYVTTDYNAAMRLYKIDKLDFLACLSSFFGVLFLSVQTGLTIAVGVSVFKIMLQVTRPNTNILGNIPGTQLYRCLFQYEKAQRVPSFLILGIGSPMYFANSTHLHERILRWAREEQKSIQSKITTTLRCIVLDMTAVTAIDTSGIDAIRELKTALNKRSL
ncbi:STAS domain-containing protein [Heracleum sosnowskyi]|uniref:STAS domain-containing protein n=1 Tax=Heracleum sosnowskyi TaxID=360622 RepID=A0AAD8I4V8_9APIA|nr:STAS domain-containing protein [Heracleum sosnowskyi]